MWGSPGLYAGWHRGASSVRTGGGLLGLGAELCRPLSQELPRGQAKLVPRASPSFLRLACLAEEISQAPSLSHLLSSSGLSLKGGLSQQSLNHSLKVGAAEPLQLLQVQRQHGGGLAVLGSCRPLRPVREQRVLLPLPLCTAWPGCRPTASTPEYAPAFSYYGFPSSNPVFPSQFLGAGAWGHSGSSSSSFVRRSQTSTLCTTA